MTQQQSGQGDGTRDIVEGSNFLREAAGQL